MAKTLLQLLNEVGKNLRRSSGSTYTTIDQNQDAVFIVQAINEAKRRVEGNWKADVLRKTVTFSTVASTAEYDTSDAGVISSATVTTDRSYIMRNQRGQLQFWDTTSGAEFRLNECTREYAEHMSVVATNEVAIPTVVAIYSNQDGLTVKFPRTPSAARTYSFQAHLPQDDLASASTELEVPWRPVVLAATAISAEERGEELGLDAQTWWDAYDNAYGNMIARDSNEEDFQLYPDTTDYIRAS